MIEEMKNEGPQPKRRNSSEITNAMIYEGSVQCRADAWSIVAETQEADVKQNNVSGSTLLKCLDANPKGAEHRADHEPHQQHGRIRE